MRIMNDVPQRPNLAYTLVNTPSRNDIYTHGIFEQRAISIEPLEEAVALDTHGAVQPTIIW